MSVPVPLDIMRKNLIINTFLVLLVILSFCNAGYWSKRAKFVSFDTMQNVGSSIKLDKKETVVNKILMDLKVKEYDEAFNDPQKCLSATHFFKSKPDIEKSQVFKFIQKLPKGASLHSHDTALVSGEFVYNLTFKENLYGCVMNGRLKLRFFGNKTNNGCDWKLMKTLRNQNASFDNFVKTQLNIIRDDPEKVYPDINSVWTKFLETFFTVNDMLCYKPVFQEYFYQALKELYEDNIMYLEFRGVLPQVYDLEDKLFSPKEVVQLYVDTLKQFKHDYPSFFGARLIFAPIRQVNNKTADDYVKQIMELKEEYPDFIVGFDLVGQEDKGKPLTDFIRQLLLLKSKKIKFFFHAGETDWNGVSTDFNLVDAVLLNTTRIGHGFSILKHPQVLKCVKKRNIAIEISPISNQVLKLIDDLRNHPGAFLLAFGYPVVICCDDPSFWGAKGLSYDWYLAFLGMASRDSDLRMLKQLALNSLMYSGMEEVDKQLALGKWRGDWELFINSFLNSSTIQSWVNV